MYKNTLTWSAVLVLTFLGCFSYLYHKFTVDSKRPSADETLIYIDQAKDKSSYKENTHLDANFDGLITNAEINRVKKFNVSNNDFEFVESLSKRDKKLLNGLTFEVAKKAVYLSDETKDKLVAMNDIDRINMINKSLNKVKNK